MTMEKPDPRDEKILSLRAKGMTIKSIAEETQWGIWTVKRVLRENNALRGGLPPSRLNDRIEQILPLVRQGMTKAEVAQHLGLSINTVANWYGAAKRIVGPIASAVAAPEAKPDAGVRRDSAPLPVGHPIVVDAMWRGLEKYREPLAL